MTSDALKLKNGSRHPCNFQLCCKILHGEVAVVLPASLFYHVQTRFVLNENFSHQIEKCQMSTNPTPFRSNLTNAYFLYRFNEKRAISEPPFSQTIVVHVSTMIVCWVGEALCQTVSQKLTLLQVTNSPKAFSIEVIFPHQSKKWPKSHYVHYDHISQR